MAKTFGIINLSPDSFSQDGTTDLMQIREKISAFAACGFYGIDIGAQATNPNAKMLSEHEEFARLSNIFSQISLYARSMNLAVSIDTFYPKIAQFAISHGAGYINDVNAMRNEDFIEILGQNAHVKYILMHSISVPALPNEKMDENSNILQELSNFASEKIAILTRRGIDKHRIIFDPGIGFGKSEKQCWDIINNFEYFRKLDCKLYLAHSKKRFLLSICKTREERSVATKVIAKIFDNKADYIRMHDAYN